MCSAVVENNKQCSAHVGSMAKLVLHLLVFKLEKRELRYIILGTPEGLATPTPLFLGADILEGSSALPAYQCRVHNKYARRGLATKLVVPSDVNFSKVTNLQNGLWFYSIQGVLQATFEYHQPQVQVEIVSRLAELWKNSHLDPALPVLIQVTMDQLKTRLSGQSTLDGMLQLLDSKSSVTSSSDATPLNNQFLVNREISAENECSRSSFFSDVDVKPERFSEGIASVDSSSFRVFLSAVTMQTKSSMPKWNQQEKSSAAALLAFLHVAELQLGETDLKDCRTFTSFLDMVRDYDFIISDDVKLKSFCSPWGIGEKSNALLCLVSEWLGRKLFCFNDAIAKRIEEFKTQNINHIQDLPPPQVLVQELFPQCMQLLVSYWIGLYGDDGGEVKEEKCNYGEDVAPPLVPVSRKHKCVPSGQSRDDHSYSSSNQGMKESADGSAVGPPAKKSRMSPASPGTINATRSGDDISMGTSYEDHNYFSATNHQPAAGENSVQTLLRDDHTYVANNPSNEDDNNAAATLSTSGNTRKDHTYVAKTHGRKCRGGSSGSASPKEEPEPVVVEPAAVKRSHAVNMSQGFKPTNSIDSSKYPFIQIILEFINNALISGVAHVVYTRLLLPG